MDIVEKRREGTAEYRHDRFFTAQPFFCLLDRIGDDLGFLRADLNAFSATDAPMVDHLGGVLEDTNRLDRAVAHAGVAFAAAFADRGDRAG